MTAPGVEGVLIEVAEDHDLHPSMNICTGCSWRPVADHGSLRRQHTAHVAAEQVRALARFVRSEGPLSQARRAVKDHLWGDEFPDDEADCCVDAVLTAIFGGAP